MDVNEVRSKSTEKLNETLQILRKEFVSLVFQKKLGQSNNISRLGAIKKAIARILTVINQRKKEESNA